MIVRENHKKLKTDLTVFPFVVASTLMFLLCLKGGLVDFIGEHALKLSFFLPGQLEASLPAGQFIILFALTWLCCLVLLFLYPRRLSIRASYIVIPVLALIFRLAVLPHPHSDDINRYLWEGRLINNGISPFHYAPNDPVLADLAGDDPFHAGINHSDISSAYPPLAVGIFALVSSLSYAPISMKVVMLMFDLGTLWFLMMLLRHRCLHPRWSILYAFNPVILYSFAGQGHFDSIQNFFLMGALYLYDRKQWGWMFLLAGLAVQSKYVAVITLPFLVRSDNWKYSCIAIITILVCYLPFYFTDPGMLFHGLLIFSEQYAFNGSFHGVLRAVFGSIGPATFICKVLLAATLLLGYRLFHPQWNLRFKNDPVSGCFFALGTLLILSPTVHFWYLSWIIPFLVVRPTMSWIILCVSISFYFVTNGIAHHTGTWRLPVWAQIMEWLPFWLLLLYNIYLSRWRLGSPLNMRSPQTVSVVIPARNEAKHITRCIEDILCDRAVCEVLVVDGGSSDTTDILAKQAGARVIQHIAPPEQGGGRGGQIHAGMIEAKGDVVAIVHADTHITAPAFAELLAILEKQPIIAGGAIGSVFNASGLRFRCLEIANDFRAVFFGITFGDQVQFFLRKPVVEADLFPDIPLMEDVELSIRLPKIGRQVFLFGNASVSARRWQTAGYAHSFLIIRLLAAYLWNRLRGKPESITLYQRYYGDKVPLKQV